MSKSASKTINISLPAKLLKEIDKAAKLEYASRSEYIRESILRRLRAEQEGWEVISDFTLIEKGGVDIDKLLERL